MVVTKTSSRGSKSRRGGSSRSSCSAKAMGCGIENGAMSVLSGADVYALSGESVTCAKASCPAYTGVLVFLVALYFFFVALMYTFRPKFAQKPNADPLDPNNLDMAQAFLYSGLWTLIVLVLVGLVVRCRRCVA